jgi:hypothetical protein
MDWVASTALAVGGVVSVFLFAVSVDANFQYRLPIISDVSPLIRGGAVFFMGVLLLLVVVSTRRVPVDLVVVALSGYLVVGATVGLLAGNVGYEYFRHVTAALTMLTGYWLGLALGQHLANKTTQLFWWGWITVAAAILAYIASIPAMEGWGYSMSPGPLLWSLSAGLSGGNWALAAIAFLLIAFGNKRDVVLGAAIVMAVWLVGRIVGRSMPMMIRCFSVGCVALVVFVATGIGVSYSGKIAREVANIEIVTDRADRMVAAVSGRGATFVPPAEGDILPYPEHLAQFETLSSGRVSLVYGGLDAVDDAWTSMLFGNGFGSAFIWRYWSDNLKGWQVHEMHQTDIAPLWFLITSGWPITLAIMLALGWRIGQAFIYATRGPASVALLMVLGMSAGMLLSFTPNNPIFWLLLGTVPSFRAASAARDRPEGER